MANDNENAFRLYKCTRKLHRCSDVLLKDIDAQMVIADKAYDAQQRVVEPLLQAGKAVVIPSIRTRTVQREYERHLYKARRVT